MSEISHEMHVLEENTKTECHENDARTNRVEKIDNTCALSSTITMQIDTDIGQKLVRGIVVAQSLAQWSFLGITSKITMTNNICQAIKFSFVTDDIHVNS